MKLLLIVLAVALATTGCRETASVTEANVIEADQVKPVTARLIWSHFTGCFVALDLSNDAHAYPHLSQAVCDAEFQKAIR